MHGPPTGPLRARNAPLWAATALATLLGAGCALDRPLLTRFEPAGPYAFSFDAEATVFYPLEGTGERVRMDWLETWLREADMCPDGYQLTGRRAIRSGPTTHRVYYTGRCEV